LFRAAVLFVALDQPSLVTTLFDTDIEKPNMAGEELWIASIEISDSREHLIAALLETF
jgi:hypothetical protein